MEIDRSGSQNDRAVLEKARSDVLGAAEGLHPKSDQKRIGGSL
jgi:hypothetical protein